MRTPACQDNAANGHSADPAWFSFAAVHAVLHLEEALAAFGIHIIGHGGSAGADGGAEDRTQGGAEPSKFGARESTSRACGANPRAKQAFVRVDISHSVEQRLIQQCGFDGELPSSKKGSEIGKGDRERLGSGTLKIPWLERQASKATRINEPQFTPGTQMQHGMGVTHFRRPGGGDQ